jgi:hypothetical protein
MYRGYCFFREDTYHVDRILLETPHLALGLIFVFVDLIPIAT